MELSVPAWVERWMDGAGGPSHSKVADASARRGAELSIATRSNARYRHIVARVIEAEMLDDAALERAAADAYLALFQALGNHHPIRLWNGLPRILDEASDQRDRYMVFNAGRHAAFDTWLGDCGPSAFAAAMPAATGVGHASSDVVIHALADTQVGTAIENPRQQPAFRYSERYGPMPPCFSRATRVAGPPHDHREHLLVSGTASVVGEDSAHVGNPIRQLEETLTNLDALIVAGGGQGIQDMTNMRVYYTGQTSPRQLEPALMQGMDTGTLSVEFMPVVLCREDLDVEIEGLAMLE